MATGVLSFREPNDNLAGKNEVNEKGRAMLLPVSSNWLMVMMGLPSKDVYVLLCLQCCPILKIGK